MQQRDFLLWWKPIFMAVNQVFVSESTNHI